MDSIDLELFKAEVGDENEHVMARTVAELWDQWYQNKTVFESTKDEVIQFLQATSTAGTTNQYNNHNHSTHRPKLTQIYDNLRSNYMSGLLPNENWFTFEPEDDSSADSSRRNKISAYLRTKHRQDKFRDTATALIDDWIIGDVFAQVIWVDEKHTTETGETIQGYRGPRVLRIEGRDIVFNPYATSFADSPKIIRSLKTIGQAAADIEERPDLAYQKEVFDKIMKIRNMAHGLSVEEIDKTRQGIVDGFASYANYIKSNFIEFLDFYGDIYDTQENKLYKNHCITVVDRMFVIRNQPSPTYNGKPTIFHAPYRKRHNNLYGMGALDQLIGMQYYINHLENSKADALDRMIIPDRVVIGNIEEEIDGEKGEKTYYISDGNGNVHDLSPDATIFNADFKIDETEAKMDLYAGSPREAMGFRTPGEKTKFEVSVLANAASRFFEFNLTQIESSLFENIINAELELTRRHLVDNKDFARLQDENTGAYIFEKITKQDLAGSGKLVPMGASHYSRKRQLAQNLAEFETVLAQDGELALHFPSVRLAKIWEEVMEFEPYNLMQQYGRIAERQQAERLMQVGQKQLEEEAAIPDDEGDVEVTVPEEADGS